VTHQEGFTTTMHQEGRNMPDCPAMMPCGLGKPPLSQACRKQPSARTCIMSLPTVLHGVSKKYLVTCSRSRGWVNMPCTTDQQVEMAYKKVGDGHPLRLWRVSTEVEAPPQELLQRVLRERHVWDYSLLKWRIVARLEPQVEVFQYVCASMAPLPAKDYCVLR